MEGANQRVAASRIDLSSGLHCPEGSSWVPREEKRSWHVVPRPPFSDWVQELAARMTRETGAAQAPPKIPLWQADALQLQGPPQAHVQGGCWCRVP